MADATDIDAKSELRDNLRVCTQMGGWKHWKAVLEEQMQIRQKELLNPTKKIDDTLEENYKKGEVAGLMQAVMMWSLLIEGLEKEINESIEEQEKES